VIVAAQPSSLKSRQFIAWNPSAAASRRRRDLSYLSRRDDRTEPGVLTPGNHQISAALNPELSPVIPSGYVRQSLRDKVERSGCSSPN
jgi:hypothetical protein